MTPPVLPLSLPCSLSPDSLPPALSLFFPLSPSPPPHPLHEVMHTPAWNELGHQNLLGCQPLEGGPLSKTNPDLVVTHVGWEIFTSVCHVMGLLSPFCLHFFLGL